MEYVKNTLHLTNYIDFSVTVQSLDPAVIFVEWFVQNEHSSGRFEILGKIFICQSPRSHQVYLCLLLSNSCIPKLGRNLPNFFVGFFRDVWTRSGGSANFRRWTHLRSRERGVQIHLRNIPRPLPPPLPGGPKGSSVRLYQVTFSGLLRLPGRWS